MFIAIDCVGTRPEQFFRLVQNTNDTQVIEIAIRSPFNFSRKAFKSSARTDNNPKTMRVKAVVFTIDPTSTPALRGVRLKKIEALLLTPTNFSSNGSVDSNEYIDFLISLGIAPTRMESREFIADYVAGEFLLKTVNAYVNGRVPVLTESGGTIHIKQAHQLVSRFSAPCRRGKDRIILSSLYFFLKEERSASNTLCSSFKARGLGAAQATADQLITSIGG